MGTNGSAVDHLDVAVVCGGDGVHHPIPYTRLVPPHYAVVAGSARAIPLWQITPRRAGSQQPKNAVQHAASVDARHSARLVGHKRLDHAPIEVGTVIPAHEMLNQISRAPPIPFMSSRPRARFGGLAMARGPQMAIRTVDPCRGQNGKNSDTVLAGRDALSPPSCCAIVGGF